MAERYWKPKCFRMVKQSPGFPDVSTFWNVRTTSRGIPKIPEFYCGNFRSIRLSTRNFRDFSLHGKRSRFVRLFALVNIWTDSNFNSLEKQKWRKFVRLTAVNPFPDVIVLHCTLFSVKEPFHRLAISGLRHLTTQLVFYCIVLYCIALHCIVVYCIVSYCIVWYGMVWYGMVWYGMVWYGIGLYCVVLHCNVLQLVFVIKWLSISITNRITKLGNMVWIILRQ